MVGPPKRTRSRRRASARSRARTPGGRDRCHSPGAGAVSAARAQRGRSSMANANTGRFVWHEHMTKDAKAAIGFYSEVVGWKTQPLAEGGGYVMWFGTQGPLGGVMDTPDEAAKMGTPPNWMGNVQVDDVDATAALAKKLGGKVWKEP